MLHTLDRTSEARPYLEDALAARRQLFGESHLVTAASQKKLAFLLLDLGELEGAEVLLRQAADTYFAQQDAKGINETRAAQDRLAEVSRRRAAEGEPIE